MKAQRKKIKPIFVSKDNVLSKIENNAIYTIGEFETNYFSVIIRSLAGISLLFFMGYVYGNYFLKDGVLDLNYIFSALFGLAVGFWIIYPIWITFASTFMIWFLIVLQGILNYIVNTYNEMTKRRLEDERKKYKKS